MEYCLPTIEGKIFSKYNNNVCIGWSEKSLSFGGPIHRGILDEWRSESLYSVISESDILSNYIYYGAWVCNIDVKLLRSEIIFPDQKCISCNLPAPHIKPNVGNNYLCSSCKFLESL